MASLKEAAKRKRNLAKRKREAAAAATAARIAAEIAATAADGAAVVDATAFAAAAGDATSFNVAAAAAGAPPFPFAVYAEKKAKSLANAAAADATVASTATAIAAAAAIAVAASRADAAAITPAVPAGSSSPAGRITRQSLSVAVPVPAATIVTRARGGQATTASAAATGGEQTRARRGGQATAASAPAATEGNQRAAAIGINESKSDEESEYEDKENDSDDDEDDPPPGTLGSTQGGGQATDAAVTSTAVTVTHTVSATDAAIAIDQSGGDGIHVVNFHNQQRDNISSNFIGSTSFLALNYEPPLGPFTGLWQDIRDENGQRLIIGQYHFTKKVQGYCAANKARDVLAALELSTKLLLEESTVHDSHSRVNDSLMKIIKTTSAQLMLNNNSFGRVNKKFVRYFIDMLSLQLVFDNWYPYAAQVAPSPYAKSTPIEVTNALQHNQSILVSLAVSMNPSSQSFYLENGSLGWPAPSLKQTFSTAVTYNKKFKQGIISSWEGYQDNYDCLWIHHWVMLQFVLPNLTVSELDDLEGLHPNGTLHFPFKHDNWESFIRHMDDGLQMKYSECYEENPKFGLVWLGKRG